VKALVQFGSREQFLPVVALDPVVTEEDGQLLEDDQLVRFDDEPEPEVFLAVEDILEGEENVSILPKHMRCAAHTLNLVATTDADKAHADEKFREASTSAMKKARQLWNAQSRSIVHADAIKDELKKRLVVPNATRWNSIFDAVKNLNEFLDQPGSR
jgi:hypothetical protein